MKTNEKVVPDIEPVKGRSTKGVSVNQYGLDGKFIKNFPSIWQASVTLKISYSGMQKCVVGTARSAGGFQWRKAE